MGWASGSRVFGEIIEILRDNVPEDKIRKDIYSKLIDVFCEMDCDTLDECVGDDDAYDEAYFEVFPEREEDYEEYLNHEEE